uniref:Hypothetical chloroplast RF65 n=1 Tax=Dasya binghamiae TaxID=1896963 RepID=A0A1C8XRZ6_9FLOR|nr:hypothetical chloroplast RF65 [Dasya binghamiae]AOH77243.1 hypothetical chloroplast RF65 [Dasya binghamiae]
MQKKIYLVHKMTLLLISIEALHLYSYEYLYKQKYYYNNKNYCFLSLILHIYSIYTIINTKTLKKLAYNIINEYNKYPQSNLVKQYLNKFTYIHNKKYNYYNYNCNHCFNLLYIHRIAMINLYIILQANHKKGVILFIKYLCKSI